MMSNASDRHEVSDARITVVEIGGYYGGGEFVTLTQADPSHVHGYTAARRVEAAGLTEEIVALADPDAFETLDVSHYDASDTRGPQLIADVRVDTHAGEVASIILNGDVLREDADPDQLEDETEVVR